MKWINIKHNLPDSNLDVLVFANDIISSWVDIACYYVCPEYEDGRWEQEGEDYPCIVTHWMPLPEKPNGNK